MPLKTYKIYITAAVSGLLLTASFQPFSTSWLAWIALVPLLMAIREKTPANAFKLGFIAGMVHFLSLIYWIVSVMSHYGGLNIAVSLSILFLFSLYLSLYPALFAFLLQYLGSGRFKVFITAFIWVALEYLRATLLTGFPWCLFGYSQSSNLNLIQISDITGVYGVSFILVLVNGLVSQLLGGLILTRQANSKQIGDSQISGRQIWGSFTHSVGKIKSLIGNDGFFQIEIIMIFFILAGANIYGLYRLSEIKWEKKDVKPVHVAVVQGNVDQAVKWNPEYQDKSIHKYRDLTLRTLSAGPSLIVWPETAVPLFFQDQSKLTFEIIKTAIESKSHLLFGSPAYKKQKNGTVYYNRAYLLSPEGDLVGYYDKSHLVPFGEYVPMKKYLPFINRLVQAVGDFIPGNDPAPLEIKEFDAGVLICFEIIFPELASAQAKKGADILVNLTNDAWFGKTSAPYQHLGMAIFRAVENKRPLVRAANTGISAYISPEGILQEQSGLFKTEYLSFPVIPNKGPPTLYARYGDFFATALLIISLIIIINTTRLRRRE